MPVFFAGQQDYISKLNQLASWDAKGKLTVGDGAGNGVSLTLGNNGEVLTVDTNTATGLKWIPLGAGTGNMVLEAAQTVSGAKTFNTNTLKLDGTFATILNGSATGSDKTITFPNISGTVALLSDIIAGGSIATDTLWAAKGDLAVATGDNAAIVLSSSLTNGQVLTIDTTTPSGLKWATVTGTLADGNKQDITVTGSTWTINTGVVSLAKMSNLAANSIIGNNTGLSAAPIALTAAQVRSLINVADGATANTGTVTNIAVSNSATGLTITGAPISGSGTLTFSFTGGYSIPTNVNQALWSTAYGWGNHASAGYLTAANAAVSYQPLDGDLTTLGSIVTTGIVRRTGYNTWTAGTLVDFSTETTGNIPTNRLDNGTDADINTFWRGDGHWATPPGGGTGDVATDTIWATKGDLVVATGNNTAVVLSAGTNNYVLTADSTTVTGLKWAATGSGTVTSVAALTIGSAGTDISSSIANSTTTPVITLNIPTASSTNRGLLSAANWTTFNDKGSINSVAISVPAELTVSGSPITGSGGTISIGYAAGYSIPSTVNQSNWDLAYTDRLKWDGGATGLVATTGRSSLGATTVGNNLFTFPNPSAIRYLRINADNTVTGITGATLRSDISAGTVNSVSGTGTVSGLTLSGTVTSTGSITLGGTLSVNPASITGIIPPGTLGTGIADSTTYLRGDNTWQTITPTGSITADSVWAAKGDLLVGTANDTAAILSSSGVNNNVLMVDTATPSGLKWAAAVTSISTSNFATGLTITGGPITTSGTLTFSFTAGYSIPTNSDQSLWTLAYTDRLKWDGGATGLVAATGRASLGATTVGNNLFTVTNPSDIRYVKINADNSVSLISAADLRTDIGTITSDTTWAAKGDLIVGTANDTAAILTKGTDTYVLTADSNEVTGLKWSAPTAGSGTSSISRTFMMMGA